MEDKQFTSVFIQPEGVDITNGIEGVENKSLALGSESSTSGSLMPSYFLQENGVTPLSVMYTGSHDNTVDAVIAGDQEVKVLEY